jgi:hypothetical protein
MSQVIGQRIFLAGAEAIRGHLYAAVARHGWLAPAVAGDAGADRERLGLARFRLIGETGFEPATARPPAGCATRLRHSPWLPRKRATGIEPALEAWKASVQPQHFARSGRPDDSRARAPLPCPDAG